MENGAQVHLLLSSPGLDAAVLPTSPWRAWVLTERGPIDPPAAAGALRPSPMSPRAERLLVAAVANDDLDALMHLAGQTGQAQEAARILAALRLATVSLTDATEMLRQALATGRPTESKVLRRHWSDLRVHVSLAPSVPALLPLDWTSLVLLLASMLSEAGRTPEALAALDAAPPLPTTTLARAALLLSLGEHARVIEATTGVTNVDDVAALTLIARSVAARTISDHATALDAVCAALIDGSRSPAVLAAALEERAHLYGLTGDSGPARADLEALAAMAAGQTDVPIPLPITLHRLGSGATDDEGEDALTRARTRMRRRISGIGEPGHFGGRHHSTYRDEIASMFASGQLVAVEELLLGLLDAVEDEVDELAAPLDPTFFLTLADLYEDSGRTEDLHALRERYREAEARAREATAAPVADAPAEGSPPAEGSTPGGGEDPASEPTPVPSGPDATALAGVAARPQPLVIGSIHGTDHEPGAVATVERPVDPDDVTSDVLDAGIDVVDDDPAPAAEDADDGSPAEESVAVDDPAAPPDERDLTPVERAVRGPRVRSL